MDPTADPFAAPPSEGLTENSDQKIPAGPKLGKSLERLHVYRMRPLYRRMPCQPYGQETESVKLWWMPVCIDEIGKNIETNGEFKEDGKTPLAIISQEELWACTM